MGTSNFEKLKLLVWKNWVLQWNHKVQLVAKLLLPTAFAFLLVIIRALVVPENENVTIYNQSLPIDNLDLLRLKLSPQDELKLKFHLAYSPNSGVVFDNLVGEAAASLGLTYSGYANSKELETALMANNYLTGVDFGDDQAGASEYPKQLNYRLRFPSELRTSPSNEIKTWMTNNLFVDAELLGPRNTDDADGGIPAGYLREGFLPVQHAIAMAFIKQCATKPVDQFPSVELQRYPYPKYVDDPLLGSLSIIMALIILLSLIYSCTSTVRYIAAEKEKQLKEIMKIMGLQNWLHWAAWFVQAFTMMGFSAILITGILLIRWSHGVAVLTYSSFTAVLFFLLIYVFVSVFACFMLATFFSKASTAATVTGLLWIITYLPYTFFQINYETASLTGKLLASLLSNTAMGLGVQVIITKEQAGEGLQWSNMFSQASVDDSLSLGYIMGMMILSSIIYMAIGLYVEQVLPGDFGVPKPWNFLFTRSFWYGEKEIIPTNESCNGVKRTNEQAFEPEPVDKNIGIQVKHLTKKFGNKTVVDDLSLNMYEDEITVLLGHNGAGKTTTISILTGMFSATSGTAIINGSDIKTNIEGARMSLGICPQHNILFDDLTVKEHLIFYSRLKGLKGSELDAEVDRYIKKIELDNKANVTSSTLSGGQKRKLSVCAALCGGTKVVLCDEPSSGMDPAARRQLWELLQSEKHGRTLLLTTHFMDEADVLGDRIAIMCSGNLECSGTSFFLKKKFGEGYRLICVKKNECRSAEVTAVLNKHIPGLQPHADIGTELTYYLPETYSSKFEKMLRNLEENSDSLCLNGYGIAVTSLEDVFMKVGAEKVATDSTSDTAHFERVDDKWTNIEILTEDQPLLQGKELYFSQWRSMIRKKVTYTIRNKMLFVIQILMPVLFIVLTILVADSSSFSTLKPLLITLHSYPRTVTTLEVSSKVVTGSLEAQIGEIYAQIISSMSSNNELLTTGQTPFIEFMLDLGEKKMVAMDTMYIAAATVNSGKIIAWLNNRPLHSAALSVNLIHNAMARAVIGPNVSISVTNAPLPYSHETTLQQLRYGENLGTQMASNLCFCMSFLSALYVMFIIKERASRAKLLQFVSGVQVTTFWFSHYLFDLATFTISALIVIITLACFQERGYSSFDELMRNFVIIFLFGVTVLPLTYLASWSFTEPAIGFARLSVLNIFCGNILFIFIMVLNSNLFDTHTIANILKKVFLSLPHFALAQGIYNLYTNSQIKASCAAIPFPSPYCQNLEPYFGWDSPGVLKQIVYLSVNACLYMTLLILNEYGVFSKIYAKIQRTASKPQVLPEDGYYDEDVEFEKKRIENMSASDLTTHNLVMDKVTKFYGKFVAVNQISVGVEHSECFGLLGVNGAGKTTTFKMLTGDEDISSGEAYVKGVSLKNDMNEVYKMIGYCPQFDALFDDFTGRETLHIYCQLRGIPDNRIAAVSEELAKSFGFMKHYDKQVHAYSGGNKRKLSTSLAVLGAPSVIYLDEPTTGMDPAARRDIWNRICRIRDAGKSVVLTSHSMEECEALCTRLAIMVNGEFKCIGSTQHIKNKFSKGFVLKLKLKRDLKSSHNGYITSQMDGDVKKVIHFVMGEFPEAFLQEEFQGILTFYIPISNVRWSSMFGLIESNMAELNVEDYSISQTTLEEIFLRFAKYQKEDPREVK